MVGLGGRSWAACENPPELYRPIIDEAHKHKPESWRISFLWRMPGLVK
jgi:hypothetical protein